MIAPASVTDARSPERTQDDPAQPQKVRIGPVRPCPLSGLDDGDTEGTWNASPHTRSPLTPTQPASRLYTVNVCKHALKLTLTLSRHHALTPIRIHLHFSWHICPGGLPARIPMGRKTMMHTLTCGHAITEWLRVSQGPREDDDGAGAAHQRKTLETKR